MASAAALTGCTSWSTSTVRCAVSSATGMSGMARHYRASSMLSNEKPPGAGKPTPCFSRLRFHDCLSGEVPIIDVIRRGDADLKQRLAQEAKAQEEAGHIHPSRVRCRQPSSLERANSALKDSRGRRHVCVPGRQKFLPSLFWHLGAYGGPARCGSLSDARPESPGSGLRRPLRKGRRGVLS